MKLTQKGFFNLMKKHDQPIDVGLANMVSEHEFKSDDCTGAIVLKVDEAKAIHKMLYNYVWEFAFMLSYFELKLPDDLLDRIKQVDGEYDGEYLCCSEEQSDQAEKGDENRNDA